MINPILRQVGRHTAHSTAGMFLGGGPSRLRKVFEGLGRNIWGRAARAWESRPLLERASWQSEVDIGGLTNRYEAVQRELSQVRARRTALDTEIISTRIQIERQKLEQEMLFETSKARLMKPSKTILKQMSELRQPYRPPVATQSYDFFKARRHWPTDPSSRRNLWEPQLPWMKDVEAFEYLRQNDLTIGQFNAIGDSSNAMLGGFGAPFGGSKTQMLRAIATGRVRPAVEGAAIFMNRLSREFTSFKNVPYMRDSVSGVKRFAAPDPQVMMKEMAKRGITGEDFSAAFIGAGQFKSTFLITSRGRVPFVVSTTKGASLVPEAKALYELRGLASVPEVLVSGVQKQAMAAEFVFGKDLSSMIGGRPAFHFTRSVMKDPKEFAKVAESIGHDLGAIAKDRGIWIGDTYNPDNILTSMKGRPSFVDVGMHTRQVVSGSSKKWIEGQARMWSEQIATGYGFAEMRTQGVITENQLYDIMRGVKGAVERGAGAAPRMKGHVRTHLLYGEYGGLQHIPPEMRGFKLRSEMQRKQLDRTRHQFDGISANTAARQLGMGGPFQGSKTQMLSHITHGATYKSVKARMSEVMGTVAGHKKGDPFWRIMRDNRGTAPLGWNRPAELPKTPAPDLTPAGRSLKFPARANAKETSIAQTRTYNVANAEKKGLVESWWSRPHPKKSGLWHGLGKARQKRDTRVYDPALRTSTRRTYLLRGGPFVYIDKEISPHLIEATAKTSVQRSVESTMKVGVGSMPRAKMALSTRVSSQRGAQTAGSGLGRYMNRPAAAGRKIETQMKIIDQVEAARMEAPITREASKRSVELSAEDLKDLMVGYNENVNHVMPGVTGTTHLRQLKPPRPGGKYLVGRSSAAHESMGTYRTFVREVGHEVTDTNRVRDFMKVVS